MLFKRVEISVCFALHLCVLYTHMCRAHRICVVIPPQQSQKFFCAFVGNHAYLCHAIKIIFKFMPKVVLFLWLLLNWKHSTLEGNIFIFFRNMPLRG